MAGLLPEFEQQFATVTADITSKICLLPTKDEDGKRLQVGEIEKLILDAKELLEKMELEVREADPLQRTRLQNRVKSHEVELARLENEFVRSKRAGGFSEAELRSQLFDSSLAGLSSGQEQEQRLLDNTETMERTSVSLTQGHRVALETEVIGAQILNDLHGQRQTIGRARDRLHETDTELGESSRVLNSMLRRVVQNRCILIFAVAVVGVVILVAIYVIARRNL